MRLRIPPGTVAHAHGASTGCRKRDERDGRMSGAQWTVSLAEWVSSRAL